MPKSEHELQKHTLFLYKGDYDRLKSLYPEAGAAVAVRKLIRKFLNEVDARVAKPEKLNVEVEL